MIEKLNWGEEVRELYLEAQRTTGVLVDFERTVVPAVDAGDVLFYTQRSIPRAFIQFVDVVLPDTDEHVLIERMLYSPRSGFAARGLINALELEGMERGCAAVLAGSSLNNNEAARRLYEASGYKTNFTFRKDLT
jgi:hypothetical protein